MVGKTPPLFGASLWPNKVHISILPLKTHAGPPTHTSSSKVSSHLNSLTSWLGPELHHSQPEQSRLAVESPVAIRNVNQ